MIGALFGLSGAAMVSLADAATRLTGRKLPLLLVVAAQLLISLLPVGGYMALTESWPRVERELWSLMIWAGLFNFGTLLLILGAIARGPMAVAVPAMSCSTIFITALNAWAGEPFTAAHAVGALATFGAVIGLSLPDGAERDASESSTYLVITLLMAVGAAVLVSIRTFWMQEAAEIVGALDTAVVTRAVAGLCALGAYFIWRAIGPPFRPAPTPWAPNHPPLWTIIILQSAFEMVGIVMFLLGGASAEGDRIAAVIGFASIAAFSPLASNLIWGERIGRRRAICIGLTIAGVAIAALG